MWGLKLLLCCLGLRVLGVGFGVRGLEFEARDEVWGLGVRVAVWGLGSVVWALGFGV